jgi:hypothetical protein
LATANVIFVFQAGKYPDDGDQRRMLKGFVRLFSVLLNVGKPILSLRTLRMTS